MRYDGATRLRVGDRLVQPIDDGLFQFSFANQLGLTSVQPLDERGPCCAPLVLEVISPKFPGVAQHIEFLSALLDDLFARAARLPFAVSADTARGVVDVPAPPTPLFTLHFLLQHARELREASAVVVARPHRRLADAPEFVPLAAVSEADPDVLLDVLTSPERWARASGFPLATKLRGHAPSEVWQRRPEETLETYPASAATRIDVFEGLLDTFLSHSTELKVATMPFPESLKVDIRKQSHHACCLCKSYGPIEVHHIVPEEDGGPDSFDNAAPLCPTCHETYGMNPTKRKFIREARDTWFEICVKRFASDADRIDELSRLMQDAVTLSQFNEFKEELLALITGSGDFPRTESEIVAVLDELWDKIWYNRHLGWKHRVESGAEAAEPNLWKIARRGARRVEKKYGSDALGPWDDFEWGMLNGKMAALRWVLGDEWDNLDT